VRLPTYAEHRRFCELDGWVLRTPVRKHYFYTKALPTGDVLTTTVSKGRGGYHSRDLWARIRREQLQVTEDEFWAAVDAGVVPERSAGRAGRPSGESLPFDLVNALLKAGVSRDKLRRLTKDEAVALWQSLLASGGASGSIGEDGP
jgi:hypothetical protein